MMRVLRVVKVVTVMGSSTKHANGAALAACAMSWQNASPRARSEHVHSAVSALTVQDGSIKRPSNNRTL